jgi:uncharacterized spore protein YtfJ
MAEQQTKKTIESGSVDYMKSVEDVQETLDSFLETARVERVYGKPVEVADTVIIPTAEVLVGFGFGMGGGFGRSEVEAEGSTGGAGEGAGGAGGGWIQSRPVAVIIADQESVRIEPVFDRTKIALAGLTAAGFMVGMVARMMRGR